MKTKIFIIISILVLLSSSALAQKVISTYTNLDTKLCKTLVSDTTNGGSYQGRCEGVAGYKLDVLEEMDRTINVIAPDDKTYKLHFGYFSKLFSDYGAKAEWRMKGKTPIALIVRVNVTDQYDYRNKYSYLTVSKITQNEVCVTDVINLSKIKNVNALKLADAAATKPCKPTR